jgi:hypothetical protein
VEDLERCRFLKDDYFAVQCTATIVEETPYVKEGSCRRRTYRGWGCSVLCKCRGELCKHHHARCLR